MSESPAATGPVRARAPRWVWIALIASLALNCLVLGIVFRSVWQIRSVYALGGDRTAASLNGYVNSLPRERGEELRRIAMAERPYLRPLRAELRRARAEIAQILMMEPLDRQRLAAAQTRLLETEVKVRQAIQRSLAEVAARMTADERRAFLRWHDSRRPGAGRWREAPNGGSDQSPPPGKRP
jgi:uncharacterized membrane protein